MSSLVWTLPDGMSTARWAVPTGGGDLPAGGTTGEVLTKLSDADGDAGWEAGGGTQPGAVRVRKFTVGFADLTPWVEDVGVAVPLLTPEAGETILRVGLIVTQEFQRDAASDTYFATVDTAGGAGPAMAWELDGAGNTLDGYTQAYHLGWAGGDLGSGEENLPAVVGETPGGLRLNFQILSNDSGLAPTQGSAIAVVMIAAAEE